MRGEDAAGFPTTCRMLVHPHMRGEQLRGPDRTIPTCVGPMCMNLTAPPCSAQPGAEVFPNFDDATPLRPPSSTSSPTVPRSPTQSRGTDQPPENLTEHLTAVRGKRRSGLTRPAGQVTLVDVDRSTPPYARVRPVARRRRGR